MCNKFEILAEISPSKRITRCMHGAIHLFWNCLHTSFSQDCLDNLLDQSSSSVEKLGDVQVIWINQIGIRLNHQDYSEFMLLLKSCQRAPAPVSWKPSPSQAILH